LAQVAGAAGDHCRYYYRGTQPGLAVAAGSNDAAADFMAQHEGKRVVGPDTVVEITEIRMAYAAARNLNDNLVVTGLIGRESLPCERLVHCGHQPSNSGISHWPYLILSSCWSSIN
jgi:hypothetical protein